jgi:hypothetical protein
MAHNNNNEGRHTMFGSIDKSKGLLFVTHDLDHSIRLTMQKMQQEVEGLDENRLLNTPPEDLKRYLVEKHGITPITLLRDQWYADHEDTPVDVRHDPMRWIDDRSRPAMVAGERVEVRIPFEGESELFYTKANTYSMNPPRAATGPCQAARGLSLASTLMCRRTCRRR